VFSSISDGIWFGVGAGGGRPRLSVTPGVCGLHSQGKVNDLIWSPINKGFRLSQIGGEHGRCGFASGGKTQEASQPAAHSLFCHGIMSRGLENVIFRHVVTKKMREMFTLVASNNPNERYQLIDPILAILIELFNNPEQCTI
jgi:hypothetical protein